MLQQAHGNRAKMNIHVLSTRRFWFVSLVTIQVLVLLTQVQAQNRNCRIGSFFNGRRCRKCRPGTYQDTTGSTSCKQCPAGTFTAFRGVIARQLCLECPEDSNSGPGARKCFKCPPGEVRRCDECKRCPKGSFFDGCTCRKCSEDSFTTEDNQSECTDCPPGMRSNEERTKCLDGGCPPGFQFFDSGCVSCASLEFAYINFKNETTGLCQPCSSRTTVIDFSAPENGCEQCPPGQFLTDILIGTDEQLRGCEPCPPGTRTVGFGKPLCREIGKPCPENTFEDEDGDCQVCDVGFRFDPQNKKCVECASNEVARGDFGFFHITTECVKCAPGQIRRFDSCGCPDRQVFRNGRCGVCRAGTYAFGNECIPCLSNEFSRAGASICTPCPPGTNSERSNGRRCEPSRCPKGLIPPPPFTTGPPNSCISAVTGCPRGLRALGFNRGSFLCANRRGKIICPKDYVFDGEGCITCSTGFRIVETKSGGLECRPCPTSRPLSDGGTTRTCRACPKGNGFVPNFGNTDCVCRSDHFIAKNGQCIPCPSLPLSQLPKECL